MSPETLTVLHRIAGDFQSDWSSHLPPDLFVAFFGVASGINRADGFVSKVNAEFPQLRIGRAIGNATAEFGTDGKLLRMPLGGFVNDALRQSNA